jgi:putative acetyltransferase
VIVRTERPSDVPEVRRITSAAFDRGDGGEPVEVRLLDELRRCDGWIPALSIVAVVDDEVVGHAVCTRGHIGALECVALGPISVIPRLQRSGIGSALMHTMLGTAAGEGEPVITLLGSPDYYGRFGFVPSTELGIDPPDPSWGHSFQARMLRDVDPAPSGMFAYASPFDEMADW